MCLEKIHVYVWGSELPKFQPGSDPGLPIILWHPFLDTLAWCIFVLYFILVDNTILWKQSGMSMKLSSLINHQVNRQYWLEMELIKKEKNKGEVITTALSPLYYAKLQAKLSGVAHHAS